MRLKLSLLTTTNFWKVIALLIFLPPSLALAKSQEIECVYIPNQPPQELSQQGKCGFVSNEGHLTVKPNHLQRLSYNDQDLACVLPFHGGAYYVHRSGRTMATLVYDVDCDRFSESLARTKINGKIAFFDPQLKIKLKTDFDWVSSFTQNHAQACYGPFQKHTQDPEHPYQTGGRCGLINRQGKIVVAVSEPLEKSEVLWKKLRDRLKK